MRFQVRVEAAVTLRTLAEVDPTCVGGLTSYAVTTINALRESLSFEKVILTWFSFNSIWFFESLVSLTCVF